MKRIALLFTLFLGITTIGWGQVDIIPVRTGPSGFPAWTDVDVAGSTYLQLLKATSSTTSPAMDFTVYTNETLEFKARTFGGTDILENTITILISTDNGTTWVSLGTRIPTSNSLAEQEPIDLSSYNGTQVLIKFTVAGTNNGVGVGIDDIKISGVQSSTGLPSPELTADITDNNVDNDIEITFTDDATWRAAITAVKVGSSSLNSDDYEISAGVIKLKPSVGNAILTVSGTKAITVSATEYSDATVSQIINPGAPASLVVTTQPAAPVTNGAVLATQPVIAIVDQYSNTVNTEVTVTAAVNEASWTLGGTLSTTTTNGTATFTDLTATSTDAITNAAIEFSCESLSITSASFGIPAPPLEMPNPYTSNITTSSFTANWNEVLGATGYQLDVIKPTPYVADFSEDFSDIGGGNTSSYLTRTWTAVNGVEWTVYNARIDQKISDQFGSAICLKDAAGAYLETGPIQGNPNTLSFDIMQVYGGSGGQVNVSILYGPGFNQTLDCGTYSFSISAQNVNTPEIDGITGPYKIRIDHNAQVRPVIDNLTFTTLEIDYEPLDEYTNKPVSSTFCNVTGLTPHTLYQYVVRAVNDNQVSENSHTNEVLTGDIIYSVEESYWYNSLAWSTGEIPTDSDDVIISEGYPITLDSWADCGSLEVVSNLTVENSGSLRVYDEAIGNMTIKRQFSDQFFHLFTLPVTNSVQASPTFNGFFVDDYLESAGAWSRLTDEDYLSPMKGYSIARSEEAPGELTFIGTVKAGGAIYTDLPYTDGAPGYSEGWNLIGNPFPSGIVLEQGIDFSGLNANIYVWDGAEGNYRTGSMVDGTGTISDGFIPAFKGFFVRTFQTDNSLTISNSAKVHGVKKSASKNTTLTNQQLTFTVSGNNYSDIMMFVINPESTYGFDQKYDAYKLYGIVEAPQLYTMVEDEKTSISHIPGVDNNSELPILIEVGAETQYTISVGNLDDFLPGTGITLKDKISGNSVDLRQNPSYTFNAKPGDNADRFSLLFSPLGTPEAMSLQANVYAIDKEIRVQLNESAKGEVKITSLAGQVLGAKSFQSSTQVTLKAPAQSGVYMVTVVTEKGTMTRKVFIK